MADIAARALFSDADLIENIAAGAGPAPLPSDGSEDEAEDDDEQLDDEMDLDAMMAEDGDLGDSDGLASDELNGEGDEFDVEDDEPVARCHHITSLLCAY